MQLGSELLGPPNKELLTLLSSFTVPTSRSVGNWDEACDAAQHDIEALCDSISKHPTGYAVPWWSAPRAA